MTWRFTDGYHPNESNQHVLLKNLAVVWLLNQGFSIEDIELEANPKHCPGHRIDVFAESDSQRFYVECESGFDPDKPVISSMNNWTGGEPTENGESEYVVCPDGIFSVRPTTKVTDLPGSDGPIESESFEFKFVSDLPEPTLQLYKSE